MAGTESQLRVSEFSPHADASRKGALPAVIEPLTPLGPYHLIERIGGGGFAEVFRAVDIRSGSEFAVKVLRPQFETDVDTVRRFEREATLAHTLKHPNIVRIIKSGVIRGRHLHIMPLIDGENLLRRLRKAPCEQQRCIEWMLQLSQAIAYLHGKEVLHRDLKPTNILIDSASDNALIIDFGLAKDVASNEQLTDAMDVLGTEAYMPPEQADPTLGEVSERSDIYGLGTLLYHMVTGTAPFPHPQRIHQPIRHQVAWDAPIRPSKHDSRVAEPLERICLKCLQKLPEHRYQSAAELMDDLARFSRGESINARLPGPTKRVLIYARRHPRSSTALLGLSLLTSAGALGTQFYARDAHDKGKSAEQAQEAASAAKRGESVALSRRKFQEYTVEMKECGALWKSGDLPQLRRVLDRQAQISPESRGFEWYYWSHLLSVGSQPLKPAFQASSLALSADGRFLAAVDETMAAVYDLQTGQRVHRWVIPNAGGAGSRTPLKTIWEQRISISPDGKLVAAVCGPNVSKPHGGSLRAWEIESGRERLAILDDFSIAGSSVTFSPDSQFVVAGSYYNQWVAWDCEVPRERGPRAKHPGKRMSEAAPTDASAVESSSLIVTDLRFIGDERLLTGGPSGTRLWNWATGLSDHEGLDSHQIANSSFLLSEAGQRCLSTDNGTLSFSDSAAQAASRRPRKPYVPASPQSGPGLCALAFSQSVAVTAHEDHVVRTWAIRLDKKAPTPLAEYRGNNADIRCVAIGGDRIASADRAGSIRVWQRDLQASHQVAFSEANPLKFTSQSGGTAQFGNVAGTRVVRQAGPGASLSVEMPDGTKLLQIPADGLELQHVAFNPDDTRLLLWLRPKLTRRNVQRVADRYRLVLWDLTTNRELSLSIGGETVIPSGVAYPPDWRVIAVSTKEKGVRLFNVFDGSLWKTCPGHGADFAKFSNSGRFLAVSDMRDTAIWDMRRDDWAHCSKMAAHQFLFETTGGEETRLLLLGSQVSCVNLTDWTEHTTLLDGLRRPEDASFSADGRRLFSILDGRLRIYAIAFDDGALLLDVPCSGNPPASELIESQLRLVQESWQPGPPHQATE